jgi:hypothetical protein
MTASALLLGNKERGEVRRACGENQASSFYTQAPALLDHSSWMV